METPYRLEKEGDGRYAIFLSDNSRAGMVLGGNGHWIGESADGGYMGVWRTRKEAAQAVADDESDPLWKAMWLIAHKANMPRSDRKSDLRIDRRTLREWRGKTDFLWLLTPDGTHTLALDPPLRDDDLLRQVETDAANTQSWLIRAKSRPGGITRLRKPDLMRLLSLV